MQYSLRSKTVCRVYYNICTVLTYRNYILIAQTATLLYSFNMLNFKISNVLTNQMAMWCHVVLDQT
jgi:hypothetical protein